MTNNIWTILSIISITLLVIYFKRGKNAVWGGFTAGIIVGFIITLFSGFNWYDTGKGAVLGVMVGFIAELLGIFSNYLRKKNQNK